MGFLFYPILSYGYSSKTPLHKEKLRKKMISVTDLYHVLTVVVLLYVAMILAYGSVKCWKIFSPDQCSGIRISEFDIRFVALFELGAAVDWEGEGQ